MAGLGSIPQGDLEVPWGRGGLMGSMQGCCMAGLGSIPQGDLEVPWGRGGLMGSMQDRCMAGLGSIPQRVYQTILAIILSQHSWKTAELTLKP